MVNPGARWGVYEDWAVLMSFLPARWRESAFAASQVLQWYRTRWQVELVFKRFKSLALLGHLPKYDDSAKAWLYGKLLVARLVEKLTRHAVAVSPWGCHLETAKAAQPVA